MLEDLDFDYHFRHMAKFSNKRYSVIESVPSSSAGKPAVDASASLSDTEDIEKAIEETVEPDWKPRKEEWLVIATLAVGSFVCSLDATILVPVLPTLAQSLNGTAQEAFWAGTSFLLANAVFQPFISSLSDIFGRRALLLPSILFFLIGSVVCGAARNFAALLAGRVIQGIGGGGMMTLAQIIFADIIPLRQRPKYFSIILGVWGLGTVTGPLIGGAIVVRSSWRWCFYINVPILAVAFLMALFFVRLTTPVESLKQKLGRVDWTGNFLFVSSLTSFLIGISFGGVNYAWSSPQTLVPLFIGIAGLATTIAWEKFVASNPFLTQSLFANPSAIFSYLCAMLQGLLMLVNLYYLPFYAMAILEKGPIGAGVFILPACCLLLPGSAVVSALITRFGYYRPFIWAGWTFATLGAGLHILLGMGTKTAVWATAFSIFGFGMGMVLSSVNFSTQAVVQPMDAGRAASMYAFFRSVGMSLGVAIGGTVFQNFMKRKLIDLNLPTSLAVDAEAYLSTLRTMTDAAQKQLIQEAYARGFSGIFYVLTAICGLGLIISFGIRHASLDQILESRFTVVKEERANRKERLPQ